MSKIDKLIFTLERLRDEKSNEIGLAAIKAIDEGLPELKTLLGEGLEQEQKQEKERPRSEIETFLGLAEQSSIRK